MKIRLSNLRTAFRLATLIAGDAGAGKRAAVAYKRRYEREWPKGLAMLRVHDTRHTFGFRLCAKEMPLETRQDLLGHKPGRVTTHYCAAHIR